MCGLIVKSALSRNRLTEKNEGKCRWVFYGPGAGLGVGVERIQGASSLSGVTLSEGDDVCSSKPGLAQEMSWCSRS